MNSVDPAVRYAEWLQEHPCDNPVGLTLNVVNPFASLTMPDFRKHFTGMLVNFTAGEFYDTYSVRVDGLRFMGIDKLFRNSVQESVEVTVSQC